MRSRRQTEEIRAELLRVLVADREGLQPYIDFPAGMPLDQFRELNRSRRWSAYFLWNQSSEVPAHIARCPVTAGCSGRAALPIEGRAPTAFFSILDANTRIPPHIGVTNTRCTVHVPLVVPPGCGFRVGSTTREWVPGQAWVFDDTIEHEAWNLSDTPRAILIFDIWNPLLTAAERDMITAATEIYASITRCRRGAIMIGRCRRCRSGGCAARGSASGAATRADAPDRARSLRGDRHADARLACYDALAGRRPAPPPRPPSRARPQPRRAGARRERAAKPSAARSHRPPPRRILASAVRRCTPRRPGRSRSRRT